MSEEEKKELTQEELDDQENYEYETYGNYDNDSIGASY